MNPTERPSLVHIIHSPSCREKAEGWGWGVGVSLELIKVPLMRKAR